MRDRLFADLGGADAAFDAALLMKVLPKFHGSRAKLEKPLRAVLAWCLNPEQPDLKALPEGLDAEKVEELVNQAQYRKTAERVGRMLRALETDGFAAFG